MALIDLDGHRVGMTTAAFRRFTRRPVAARAPHACSGASTISIRLAGRDEQEAIARLAALAERPVPTGRALVAEVDGEVRAALPLPSGAAIVDPFRPSTRAAPAAGPAGRAARRERLSYSSERKTANAGFLRHAKFTRPERQ